MDKPYSIISLKQDTPEWLAWRNEGIGGSDASTIMGENKFQCKSNLLREKCSHPTKSRMNSAMALGVALEPKARAYYNTKCSVDSQPMCIQSSEYEWLRASLDGISSDGSRVVEIKCGQSAYKITAKTRRPPRYYYGQFQHLMAVTALDSLDYCCYFPPGRPLLIKIERNQSYIDKLLRLEEAFWKEVIEMRIIESDNAKTSKNNTQ
ncbi:MAG: YqaJ viral recombinase family protein [Rubritalea sp.]|tara:strand:- start:2235 stop:2855 length:621 start_codon:yes stop_codon:yes gene_type:complete